MQPSLLNMSLSLSLDLFALFVNCELREITLLDVSFLWLANSNCNIIIRPAVRLLIIIGLVVVVNCFCSPPFFFVKQRDHDEEDDTDRSTQKSGFDRTVIEASCVCFCPNFFRL